MQKISDVQKNLLATGKYKGLPAGDAHIKSIKDAQAIIDTEKLILKQEDSFIENQAKQKDKFKILLTNFAYDLSLKSSYTDYAKKKKLKRNIVNKYTPVINSYIKKKDNYPNQILVELMVLNFDLANINKAMEYAVLAKAQKQQKPERFYRNLDTIIVDLLLVHFKNHEENAESLEFLLDEIYFEIENYNIPLLLKIKLLKTKAKVLEIKEQYQSALEIYLHVIKLEPNRANCKTAISKLKKKLGLSLHTSGFKT